jgi:hypothetical protein
MSLSVKRGNILAGIRPEGKSRSAHEHHDYRKAVTGRVSAKQFEHAHWQGRNFSVFSEEFSPPLALLLRTPTAKMRRNPSRLDCKTRVSDACVRLDWRI